MDHRSACVQHSGRKPSTAPTSLNPDGENGFVCYSGERYPVLLIARFAIKTAGGTGEPWARKRCGRCGVWGKTLRVTPAMEAGVTDRLFSYEELVGIVDEWETIQKDKEA